MEHQTSSSAGSVGVGVSVGVGFGGSGGETSAVPSKVLHMRNVPSEATERDVALLGVPFGRITALVLAKRKNQALLEMELDSQAAAAVNYFQVRTCYTHLRGGTVGHCIQLHEPAVVDIHVHVLDCPGAPAERQGPHAGGAVQ